MLNTPRVGHADPRRWSRVELLGAPTRCFAVSGQLLRRSPPMALRPAEISAASTAVRSDSIIASRRARQVRRYQSPRSRRRFRSEMAATSATCRRSAGVAPFAWQTRLEIRPAFLGSYLADAASVARLVDRPPPSWSEILQVLIASLPPRPAARRPLGGAVAPGAVRVFLRPTR